MENTLEIGIASGKRTRRRADGTHAQANVVAIATVTVSQTDIIFLKLKRGGTKRGAPPTVAPTSVVLRDAPPPDDPK